MVPIVSSHLWFPYYLDAVVVFHLVIGRVPARPRTAVLAGKALPSLLKVVRNLKGLRQRKWEGL